jgi:putative thioredoxin
MADFTITATDADFDSAVIASSRQTPVIVDFWAPWCGPCRTLTPILEKLAEEYQGKFVLAKINADENPALSQRFSVRSIPSVMAFADGEVIDQFLGAQPESAVRAFLDRVLPTAGEVLRSEAAELRAGGELDAALNLLNEAAQLEPNNEDVLAELVETLLDLGRVEQARQTSGRLGHIRAPRRRAAQALARLGLVDDGGQPADAAVLEARIHAQPDDLESRLTLAKLYAREHEYERALEQLLATLRRDRTFGDDIARKTMLALFELLGSDDPLVRKYRKELAAALY